MISAQSICASSHSCTPSLSSGIFASRGTYQYRQPCCQTDWAWYLSAAISYRGLPSFAESPHGFLSPYSHQNPFFHMFRLSPVHCLCLNISNSPIFAPYLLSRSDSRRASRTLFGIAETAPMQNCIVISGFDTQPIPPVRLQIPYRVILFKQIKEPVSGGIEWGYEPDTPVTIGEEPLDAAVCPLHGVGIGRVECAFMLVDQYAVLGQRLIAVAVEFLGKQTFTPPNGSVESTIIRSYSFSTLRTNRSVLIVNMYPRIVQTACCKRQILFRQMHTSSSISTMSICSMEVAAEFPYRAAVVAPINSEPF